MLDHKIGNQPNYITSKRHIFYFSRRIPTDLQYHYKQARIVQSLRTKDLKEAGIAARILSGQLEKYWFQLRLKQLADDIPVANAIKDKQVNLTLNDALDYYIQHKGNNRGKRFAEHAERHIHYLLKAIGGNKPLEDCAAQDALAYRAWLKGKGLSNATVRQAFASIKAMFTFVTQEHGLTIQNPFSNIYLASAKDDEKKRLPIAIADIRLIQSHCKAVDDDMRWLVALISDTGMRLSEAAGLMMDDLRLNEDIPHVVIQPHKHRPLKTRSSERIVPLVGASLWAAQRIKQNAQGAEYCFPRYCNTKACNANSASAALNKWLKVVTGNKDYVLHGLRHSFRDRLRTVDAPIEMVDRLGGWSLKTVGQSYGDGYRLGQIHLTMKMLGAE